MALADEMAHFLRDLLLGQRPPLELSISGAEGAVQAVVGAQVGDVQRREDDEAAAVDSLLHALGGGEERVQKGRIADSP